MVGILNKTVIQIYFNEFKKRALLGIIIATSFCSMWLNNAAAAGMMLPLAVNIAKEITSLETSNKRKHVFQDFFRAF